MLIVIVSFQKIDRKKNQTKTMSLYVGMNQVYIQCKLKLPLSQAEHLGLYLPLLGTEPFSSKYMRRGIVSLSPFCKTTCVPPIRFLMDINDSGFLPLGSQSSWLSTQLLTHSPGAVCLFRFGSVFVNGGSYRRLRN